MKFRKIVGFGDSWMYGDELLDPELAAQDPAEPCCSHLNDHYRKSRCALGLLGQHYGVPTENFGIPGGSLISTQWTFLWWLERETVPEQCLVVIFLPDSGRFSFLDPRQTGSNNVFWQRFSHSTWATWGLDAVSPEFQDLVKRHMVLTDCQELRDFRYNQTVLFFDGQRARLDMPTLQVHVAQGRPATSPVLPSLPRPNFSLWSYINDHSNRDGISLFKPRQHPNEKGHELIRDLLISDIDHAILME